MGSLGLDHENRGSGAPRGAHFAGSGTPRPRPAAPRAAGRPDETSVFMAAAASRPTAPRRPSPDETAAFMIAAGQSSGRASALEHAALTPAQMVPGGDRPSRALVGDGEDALFAPLPEPIPADLGEDAGSVPSEPAAASAREQAEKSSNMLSLLVIVSRITGFVRTSAQAWSLGLTGLASTYTVADNMPNLLYELVMGGMLITSFLPVYVAVKKRAGRPGASAYASNLISLVLLLMGALTVVSFIFAVPIIWTQTAGATEGFDFDLSVWFFRWFVCEIVLYALSSLISGVLNAERDYFWSNFAPILNNVILISSFAIYGYLVNVAGVHWSDAVIVLAIGNPLGVAVQVAAQLPALRRHGVRLHLRVDLHDPALRETLSIGLPTLVVTFASFPTTAVMSSCALSVTAAGASISYYSRVWYVLPFSIFAIPLSVTMFTELSSCRVAGDDRGFIDCLAAGTRKILFTLIPFAMYLMVFAPPLIAVFSTGRFSDEAAWQTVGYLQALAPALPLYGLSTYLQKVCSSMLKMRFFAVATCVASALQIAICLWLTPVFGLFLVPISSIFFYGALDLVTFARLRAELGPIGMRGVAASVARSLVFGALGAGTGWLILQGLTLALGPCEGIVRALAYAAAGGLPAVAVTFGLAHALGKSDAPFFDALIARLRGRLVRA